MTIQALAAGLRSNVRASRWTMAPPFLMTIWAVKALEPSLRVRPTIVPTLSVGPIGTNCGEKVRHCRTAESKIGLNEPETVRHKL